MTAAWPAIPTVQYRDVSISPLDQRTYYTSPASLPKEGSLSTDVVYQIGFDAILSGSDLATFWSWWNTTAARGAELVSGLEDIVSDDPTILYRFAEPPRFQMIRSGSVSVRRYRASFKLWQQGLGTAIGVAPPGTVVLDRADATAHAKDIVTISPALITLDGATAAVAGTDISVTRGIVLDSATVAAAGADLIIAIPGVVTLTTGTAAAAGSDITPTSTPGLLTLDSGSVGVVGADVLGSVRPVLDSASASAAGTDIVAGFNPIAAHFSGTNYLKTTAFSASAGKLFVFSTWVRIPTGITGPCWILEIQSASTSTGNNVFFFVGGDGKFYFHGRLTQGGTVTLDGNGSFDLRTNTWTHIALSCDMANAANRMLVVNRKIDTGTVWNTYVNQNINWANTTSTIGARNDGSTLQAFDIAETFLGLPGSYFDPVNAGVFVRNDGVPVPLGSTGQLPLGATAKITLNATTIANWHTNAGDGGGYTETSGAMTAGTGPVRASIGFVLSETWTGTNGAAWPAARWTNSSVGSTSVIDIQSNNGRMVAQGAAYTYARIDAVVGTLANIDFVGSFAMATTGEQYHGLYVRSAGQSTDAVHPDDPANGYCFEIDASGLLAFFPIVNSVRGTVASVAKTWGTGNWGLRVQCVGTTVRARAWQGTEPTTWDINQTNSSIASGGVRLRAINGNATTARTITWNDVTITDSPA